ncbi:MAG: amidohydrolase family protein [Chloroflexia bacterium]|nr:amidohydrolase family protein [Chloroflexia bacterium]
MTSLSSIINLTLICCATARRAASASLPSCCEPSEPRQKTVLPGFIDAHCHFTGYGLDKYKCRLFGTASFEEVLERIKEYDKTNKYTWIYGRGWDQNDWEVKEFPTNEKLDEAFPDKPVILTRVDGHALIANSEALKRAGITVESKIEGGKFLKKDGKLTGVLVDNAEELMMAAVPKPDIRFKTRALLEAQKACFAVGLTTVDDAGLSKEVVQVIDELQKADTLKMRIYAMLNPSQANLEHFVKKGAYKTDF